MMLEFVVDFIGMVIECGEVKLCWMMIFYSAKNDSALDAGRLKMELPQ